MSRRIYVAGKAGIAARAPGRGPGGFTLVELMAVIAIIALLLSILLPSLQKARQMAQRVPCQANIRNMVNGAALYASANGGVLPCNQVFKAPSTLERDANGNVVRDHSWWPHPDYWTWYWCDLMAGYFDSDARPAQSWQAYYVSIGNQPADDTYDRWQNPNPSWAPPVVYSRRMNCPAQKKIGQMQYSYVDTSLFDWILALWRSPAPYAGGSPYGPGTVPPVGQYDDPADQLLVPGWMAASSHVLHKMNDIDAQRYCLITEPAVNTYIQNFPDRAVAWAQNMVHLQTVNGGYLDGHVDIFTKDYFLNFPSLPVVPSSTNAAPAQFDYPFWVP